MAPIAREKAEVLIKIKVDKHSSGQLPASRQHQGFAGN